MANCCPRKDFHHGYGDTTKSRACSLNMDMGGSLIDGLSRLYRSVRPCNYDKFISRAFAEDSKEYGDFQQV